MNIFDKLSGKSERTARQVEQEIEARTEACMDEKKNNQGGFFTLLGNREANRGKCNSYARQDLAAELQAAQEREAQTQFAINDATEAQARAQQNFFSTTGFSAGSPTTLLILAVLALTVIALLFLKK